MDSFSFPDGIFAAPVQVARERRRLYGVYPAIVKSIADPDQQGRIKVLLPWSPDGNGAEYQVWARLATMMAGANRGSWFIPDIDDEVLVAFEGGDPRRPYVVGSLWNGQDAPPEQMDSGEENNRKVIVSRNQIRIILDDSQGQESVTIETPGGQTIVLQDGPGSITVSDSNGNQLTMDAGGISLNTPNRLSIQASTINMSAALVNVDTPQAVFSTAIKSILLETTSVVSATYSPGAGNIW